MPTRNSTPRFPGSRGSSVSPRQELRESSQYSPALSGIPRTEARIVPVGGGFLGAQFPFVQVAFRLRAVESIEATLPLFPCIGAVTSELPVLFHGANLLRTRLAVVKHVG